MVLEVESATAVVYGFERSVEWEYFLISDVWHGRKRGDFSPPKKIGRVRIKLAWEAYSKKAVVPATQTLFSQATDSKPVRTQEDPLDDLEVNNTTVLVPDYIHPDIEGVLGSKLPSYMIFARPSIRGDRHYAYCHPNEDRTKANQWGKPRFLPGVTSIIKKTMPTPESLIQWLATYPGGLQAARDYTDLASAKGTIMHGIFADFVNGRVPEFDSTDWHEYIDMKIRKQKVDPRKYHGEWSHFMRKALLSLMQWVIDYNVTFILMEIGLVSERLGYSGQIDVVCEMDYEVAGFWGDTYKTGPRKGDPKETKQTVRVKAIVDFKSGEHSHDSHHIQLALYLPLLQEHFPTIDWSECLLFNWHPTDWVESPGKGGDHKFSCKFINQTDKARHSYRKTQLLLDLYKLDARESWGDVLTFKGKPVLGGDPRNFVDSKPFEEHWEETFHLALDLGLSV